MRKSVITIIAVVLPISLAQALTLGGLVVKSALDQPLRVEIPIRNVRDVSLDQIEVQLATPAEFQRLGITRPNFLSGLQFQVVNKLSSQEPVLLVTSRLPIDEPVVRFLVSVAWPTGKMLHTYTVLLDPINETKELASHDAISRTATPLPENTITTASKVLSPKEQNIPTLPILTGKRPKQALPLTDVKLPTTSGAAVYGSVPPDASLLALARDVRANDTMTVAQVALAIQRINPRAFLRGNINGLMANTILRLPSTEEVLALSATDARKEVNTQNEAWRQGQILTPIAPLTVMLPQSVPAEQQIAKTAPQSSAEETVATPGNQLSSNSKPLPMPDTQAQPKSIVGVVQQSPSAISLDSGNQLAVLEPDHLADTLISTPSKEIQQVLQTELAVATGNLSDTPVETQKLKQQLTDLQNHQKKVHTILAQRAIEITALQQQLSQLQKQLQTDALVIEKDAAKQMTAISLRMWLLGLGIICLLGLTLGFSQWRRLRQFARRSQMPWQEDQSGLAFTGFMSDAHRINELDEFRQTAVPATDSLQPAIRDFHEVATVDKPKEPLEEASVYIAYGRYAHAKMTLEDAVAKAPTRLDLQMKLLEVYLAIKDRVGFDVLLAKIPEEIREKNLNLWAKIQRARESFMWTESAAKQDRLGEHVEQENTATTGAVKAHVIEFANQNDSDEWRQAEVKRYRDQGDGLEDQMNQPERSDSKQSPVERNLEKQLGFAEQYLKINAITEATVILRDILQNGSVKQQERAQKLLSEIIQKQK